MYNYKLQVDVYAAFEMLNTLSRQRIERYLEENAYRPGTWCETSVGKVWTAEIPKVRDHEKGISNIWRGLEETSILASPENCKTSTTPPVTITAFIGQSIAQK